MKLYIEIETDTNKIIRFFSEFGGDIRSEGASNSDSMIFVKANEIDKFTRGVKYQSNTSAQVC